MTEEQRDTELWRNNNAEERKRLERLIEINDVVNKAVKEAIREIAEAEYFRELVDCLVFAAEKRREDAKDDI